jgi:hypothetical protein
MSTEDRASSPAMGVANMLSVHVLPYIAEVEDVDTRKRLMEHYDSMLRVALKAHAAR